MEDLHANFVGCTEVGVVIQPEIRGRVHVQVQVIENGQFTNVIVLDGKLVRGSEDLDRVFSRQLRVVCSQRGRGGIAAIQGHIQVADVGDQ